MSKPKRINFTEKLKTFIIEKMSEGLTVQEIHKKYPNECPKPNSVYKKCAEDDEWNAVLDKGYTLWYFAKQEELDRLSTGLASEIYPGIEFREAEAALKRRIDALKFSLGKMAPIMSKRFDKTTKIEVEGDGIGQLAVINYYATNDSDSLKDITNSIDLDKIES